MRPAGPSDELRLEAAAPERQDDLLALRPPVPEDAVELGRRDAAGHPGAGVRGSASSAATARSSASASGARLGARVRQHDGTRALAAVHDEAGQEARHRAPVADEDPVAATVEPEPEPPPELQRSSSTIACTRAIRSSTAFGSTASSPSARNVPQRARSAAVDHSQPAAPVDSVTSGSGSSCTVSVYGST